MNVLINHCWCSDSNWGGHYNCRVIVSIDMVPKGKTYYDPHEPDWLNLLEKHDLVWEKFGDAHRTYRLRPEIIQWLQDSIKDRQDDKQKKAWCVGTDKYNANMAISFPIFFERPSDALKFIKRWSSHKHPVHYLNYFQDIRRELDFATGRMKRVPRWGE